MKHFDQPLLRLQGVTKVFFTNEVETHALSGIHLEIDKGEFVSIGGPSGCGKSTLLSILGLLDSPTDGTYLLGGKSIADLLDSTIDEAIDFLSGFSGCKAARHALEKLRLLQANTTLAV